MIKLKRLKYKVKNNNN